MQSGFLFIPPDDHLPVSCRAYLDSFSDIHSNSFFKYGHQNELCKIERQQKCCCNLFISELNENGVSYECKTKCDIALQTLYI